METNKQMEAPKDNLTVFHPPIAGYQTRRSFWQRLNYSENFWAYLFLLPTIIGLIVFTLGPIVAALGISLTHWNLVNAPVWAGFSNYTALFSDQLFWKSMWNTTRYMVMGIPLEMLSSLILAFFLNQRLRGLAIFRTIFFIPGICSIVAIALVWRQIFDFKIGMLNAVLNLFGVNPIPWLMTTATAMPAIVLMSVWQGLGYPTLLWLAALQGVPQTYYDAADVDGAGRWAKFLYVTWPFITPTAFFMMIMDVISSFQVFQQTFVLTAGGPAKSTYTLVYYIYEKAFRNFLLGDASAAAYILFFIMLVLTIVQFRMQKQWVHYEMA